MRRGGGQPQASRSGDEAAGTVETRIDNNAAIGERKNMNLPGVIVDLPTLTEKDINDIVNFGCANKVDFIAASFVRKASDVHKIREVLGVCGLLRRHRGAVRRYGPTSNINWESHKFCVARTS